MSAPVPAAPADPLGLAAYQPGPELRALMDAEEAARGALSDAIKARRERQVADFPVKVGTILMVQRRRAGTQIKVLARVCEIVPARYGGPACDIIVQHRLASGEWGDAKHTAERRDIVGLGDDPVKVSS